MSTLANEFLNDINSDDEDTTTTTTTTTTTNDDDDQLMKDNEDSGLGDQEDLMLTDELLEKRQNELISNLKDAPLESIATLKNSNKLTSLLSDIQHEIYLIHKFVRGRYSIKFPELDTSVQNPLDYISVVKRIGNETDLTKVNLNDLLPKTSIMILVVTFSSTTGKNITDQEMAKITDACNMALELDTNKKLVSQFDQ
eukprot:gene5738-6640_t